MEKNGGVSSLVSPIVVVYLKQKFVCTAPKGVYVNSVKVLWYHGVSRGNLKFNESFSFLIGTQMLFILPKTLKHIDV